ncbi:hypothetical protein PENTCL1PPCAC_11954 [Pristionchus entomophagus]|uniref:Peptidase S1 domain-containing protein n=1 Tax=Pristionchus entomophagus TaxID=358040 RepID=A0AAV5T3F6_9BILA|nr:hypothetical protein PENTCL1PPCAC_11954 [Pristionchus entomophagus]
MEFKGSIRACSATLISSRHLLTASHCVLDIEKCFFCMNGEKQEDVQCPGYSNADKTSHPSSWTIAYGGHCDTRIGVRAIAWDERFVNKCFEFDMAIIELERYIEFDFESGSILPICLADSSFPFNDAITTFFGFGVVAENNDATQHFLYSQLRYGTALHTFTKLDGSEMFLDHRPNRTESERVNFPFMPRAQFSRGDSGGGLSTTACDGSTVLIGANSHH